MKVGDGDVAGVAGRSLDDIDLQDDEGNKNIVLFAFNVLVTILATTLQ